MNIPNTLTLGRILLVPLLVWLIIDQKMLAAFLLFMAAGLSDAADGYLAKRYGWHTELAPISTRLPIRLYWSRST
ncbi:CDP-alcohol phosphatidyltransferase family protein [Methyloceanibacter superfactus]|uniref:CDP-alcohol phosphatidyltransferase family protein n=1 Tax=Methyloceanibacter superfactus TaxID=1774969 RepID=UPI00313A3C80